MKTNKVTKSTKNFDELLDKKYGRIGTKKRDAFEKKSKIFVLGEILKSAT